MIEFDAKFLQKKVIDGPIPTESILAIFGFVRFLGKNCAKWSQISDIFGILKEILFMGANMQYIWVQSRRGRESWQMTSM
jgi:hypothetical protein